MPIQTTERIIETARGRSMIDMNGSFLQHQDAVTAMDTYCCAYHPAGYGTRFEPLKKEGEIYLVKGSRGRSCD